ncbi:ScbR family autoregulator-binding transcription factor [Streptomyces boluensis]|uniref:TetR family transcriptional regulator n=1 Tax=Streptomyces boluensis TaxID=1775135 RepID=A0A964UJ33_9ACTN|nr:ScbR family autoregulator-binding transcription factor [Streptomyces boluensis]NBE49931.1 TetR family transcriptional regulator [Streptomyces boluensis]
MARQERGVRTRRNILETMAGLINEVGYEAATISMLVERTGLTRGALYFHFSSKEEMARGVLAEALTSEGVREQEFKLQEWVDIGMLLAYRLPREPLMSAAIRLSIDAKARNVLGTRWPDWVDLGRDLLTEAKRRGELLPHADPWSVAKLAVGSWTGVQLVTEALPESAELVEEISALYQLLLPNVATAGVLARLDTSPRRAEQLARSIPGAASETVHVPAT